MFGWFRTVSSLTAVMVFSVGCINGVVPAGDDSTAAADVATKTLDVAEQVGGTTGFGGALMDGYVDHMPGQMGFNGQDDLAPGTSDMMVMVRNDSDRDGTFHLSYVASHMGLEDRMMDIEVGAGEEVAVEIPCSEIVGMGPLDMPGEAGCHLADGEAVENTMAVPGFFGQDFTCEGVYECTLATDVDDLDGDGDTEELIIVSDAMEFHMTDGGPTGHMHGTGSGMMGSHMGM